MAHATSMGVDADIRCRALDCAPDETHRESKQQPKRRCIISINKEAARRLQERALANTKRTNTQRQASKGVTVGELIEQHIAAKSA